MRRFVDSFSTIDILPALYIYFNLRLVRLNKTINL